MNCSAFFSVYEFGVIPLLLSHSQICSKGRWVRQRTPPTASLWKTGLQRPSRRQGRCVPNSTWALVQILWTGVQNIMNKGDLSVACTCSGPQAWSSNSRKFPAFIGQWSRLSQSRTRRTGKSPTRAHWSRTWCWGGEANHRARDLVRQTCIALGSGRLVDLPPIPELRK